jgi:hypothetical protein
MATCVRIAKIAGINREQAAGKPRAHPRKSVAANGFAENFRPNSQ